MRIALSSHSPQLELPAGVGTAVVYVRYPSPGVTLVPYKADALSRFRGPPPKSTVLTSFHTLPSPPPPLPPTCASPLLQVRPQRRPAGVERRRRIFGHGKQTDIKCV